jgi:branched-chain amino acid transport system substrate-binding protein
MDVWKRQLQGVQMAAEEVNASGGVLGSKFEVVTADTAATATGTISAYEKLVLHDKVDMIIGGFSSEEATALQEQAAKHKLITLSGGGSNKLNQTYLNDRIKYRHTFFLEPDEFDAASNGELGFREYVKQIKNNVKDKVGVALVTDKALWTEAMDPALKDMIVNNPDCKLVYHGKIGRDATNFTAELSQIRRAKSHLIFVVSGFNASIPFTKQWAQLKVPSLITGILVIAMSPSVWVEALGAESAAYTGSNCLGIPAVDERSFSLIKKYTDKYKQDPSYASCAGYLNVMAYAEAVKTAKTLDADALVPVFENLVIPPERSWGGTLDFDTDHRAKFGPDGLHLVWFQYAPDGKVALVAPPEVANSKILIPDYMINGWKSWE